MSTTLKEWLLKTIAELEQERNATPDAVNEDAAKALAAMKLALASLEAEAVCVIDQSNLDYLKSGSDADVWPASRAEMGDVLLYRSATPAPVSVPAAMEMDDDFDSAFEHGKAVGWNAYRAAMLQGVDRPQNEPQNIPENIPATQFKPVADLYGLTSPTGGETSFTFDAVEARDFIDGGWSCQEYVELGRYQEALTDHSEDKLAMVDHSGDSNNMVEPVTTACKLPMQPLVIDAHGTLRFKENPIVRDLLDYATEHGYGLNEIALEEFDAEDQMQLAQLIGYSLSGYGTLSYVTDESYERTAAAAPQQEVTK